MIKKSKIFLLETSLFEDISRNFYKSGENAQSNKQSVSCYKIVPASNQIICIACKTILFA